MMRDRAERMGWTLRIAGRTGEGTEVEITNESEAGQ